MTAENLIVVVASRAVAEAEANCTEKWYGVPYRSDALTQAQVVGMCNGEWEERGRLQHCTGTSWRSGAARLTDALRRARAMPLYFQIWRGRVRDIVCESEIERERKWMKIDRKRGRVKCTG